jgi:hypothetical protein
MSSNYYHRTGGGVNVDTGKLSSWVFPGVKQVVQQTRRPVPPRSSSSQASEPTSENSNSQEDTFHDPIPESDRSSLSDEETTPRYYDLPEPYHLDLEKLCERGACRKEQTLEKCRGRSERWKGKTDEELDEEDPRIRFYKSYKCKNNYAGRSPWDRRSHILAAMSAANLSREPLILQGPPSFLKKGIPEEKTRVPSNESQKEQERLVALRAANKERDRRVAQRREETQYRERLAAQWAWIRLNDMNPDSSEEYSLIPAAVIFSRGVKGFFRAR